MHLFSVKDKKTKDNGNLVEIVGDHNSIKNITML